MRNLEDDYNKLISVTDLIELDDEVALNHIGLLVDVSYHAKKIEGLEMALSLSKDLMERNLTPGQTATLNYFLANAWAFKRNITRGGKKEDWDWEQHEIEREIFHLRSALYHEGFGELPNERKCQILTNLANLFDYIGRFVEALEYWDKALVLIESFPMARGNRGIGLADYSRMLFNKHQQVFFLKIAHEEFIAIQDAVLHKEAENKFNEYRIWLDSLSKDKIIPEELNLDDFSLGKSAKEVKYRKWCLLNRLFLNPLNDLGIYPVAAEDLITVPSIVYKIDEGPFYHGFFNQIKQEFVSARYVYYEGMNEEITHFSDRKVLLYNTLDYPSYSIAIDKVKDSFRIQYSIFDKIAYFLNDYLDLSIPKTSVNFRTFWYQMRNRKKGIRAELKQLQNRPLRGLFWLSKDLYEDKPGFRDFIEPEAKELHNIRNHLEHKYLKLHEGMWMGKSKKREDTKSGLLDSLAFSLYREEFEAKTLKLIKLIRSALLYLALAINIEEQKRKKQRGDNKIIPTLPLDIWEDDWKI